MGAFENLLVDDFRCDSYSYVTASDFPFSPISAEQIHIQINCNILQQSVTKVPTCQFFGHLGLYRPAFLADSYMISQDLASSAIFHFNPDLGYSGITFLHHFLLGFLQKNTPWRCHSLRGLRHSAGGRDECAAADPAQLAQDLGAAPGQVPPAGGDQRGANRELSWKELRVKLRDSYFELGMTGFGFLKLCSLEEFSG